MNIFVKRCILFRRQYLNNKLITLLAQGINEESKIKIQKSGFSLSSKVHTTEWWLVFGLSDSCSKLLFSVKLKLCYWIKSSTTLKKTTYRQTTNTDAENCRNKVCRTNNSLFDFWHQQPFYLNHHQEEFSHSTALPTYLSTQLLLIRATTQKREKKRIGLVSSDHFYPTLKSKKTILKQRKLVWLVEIRKPAWKRNRSCFWLKTKVSLLNFKWPVEATKQMYP